MMNSFDIEPSENFGRRAKSKSRAVKAYKSRNNRLRPRIPFDVFVPPVDKNEISVDRLDKTSVEEIVRIVATSQHRFFGWYTLTVDDVNTTNCIVNATPIPDNMFHADIVFPIPMDSTDRKDEIREIALKLSNKAKFRRKEIGLKIFSRNNCFRIFLPSFRLQDKLDSVDGDRHSLEPFGSIGH